MEHLVGWLYTLFSFKMVFTVKDITALQPSPKARTLQHCTFLSRGGQFTLIAVVAEEFFENVLYWQI